MSLTKITAADTADKGVVGLPDAPNLSVTALQKKFDELATDVIIPKFNALSGELDDLTIEDRIASEDDGTGTSKITNIKLDEDGRMVVSTDGGDTYTSASSSGHIIVNGAGVEFPAENRLQFSDNVVVTDYPDTKKTFLSIPSGQKGDKGESATVSVGEVENSETAYVRNVGSETDAIFDFGLPSGAKGDAATVTIGNVSSGDAASVTNSGTTSNAVFNFVLPKGDKGDAGTGLTILDTYETLTELQTAHPVGKKGDTYIVGTPENNTCYLWSTTTSSYEDIGQLKGAKGDKGDKGEQGNVGQTGATGAKGDTGAAATISVGTVVTGATPSITNSGTNTNAIFDFVIPKGEQGEQGVPTVVNGKTGQSVTLYGTDVSLNGYAKKTESSAIAADETVQNSIGKLEYKADKGISDASAVSTDLNAHLTYNGKGFYLDEQDGVYGWNEDSARGADTFHPFKSGGGEPEQIRTSETWNAVNSKLVIEGNFSDKHYAIIEMRYAAATGTTTSAVPKDVNSTICAPQNISSTAQGYVASRSVLFENDKLTINTPTWNNYGLLRNIWVI